MTRKEVTVSCVRFSATGREWAAATSDGLLVYALNEDLLFDPIDMDESVTPQAVLSSALRDNAPPHHRCCCFPGVGLPRPRGDGAGPADESALE
jgi:hypothetical protein